MKLIAFAIVAVLAAWAVEAQAGTCYYQRDFNGRVTGWTCN